MRRFLLTLLVASMALSISVDARKIEKVSITLQNQQKLRVSTKAMAQRKHFEMLAAEHGVTIEWIDNLVEGATNAWTGMTNSFSRLATRFSTGVREFKDQTKYLLNMLQLKKPGGYTAAFCKHARDDTCAVVDNYPWPRSLTKLKWDDVKAGLETVSKDQTDGKIFRGNELGYLILNPKLWSGFGDKDTHTIGLGMSVAEHKEIRPVLDAILGHGSSAWSKQQVKDSVSEFLTNAPARDRPQMKLTYANMEENCDKHDSWGFNTEKLCKDCGKLEYCDAELGTRMLVVPHCFCKFNKGKADDQLNKRNTKARKREVLRVQEDVKIWSTKLLHKIHLDMDMSDEEAARFTSMQGTSIHPQ